MAETQDQAIMAKTVKESKRPKHPTPPRYLPPLRNTERHTKATSSL